MTARGTRAASSRLVVPLLAVVLLAGCAAEPAAPAGQDPAASTATEAESPDTAAEPQEPATQEESCGWDAGPLTTGVPGDLPAGPGSDLSTALVGAWQHTHYDTGAGFEPLGEGIDIRFVFPSASRVLYCQDVAGATSQAENAVDFELVDSALKLPDPAPGYVVTAWDGNTMLWTNNLDQSTFLLQRRS